MLERKVQSKKRYLFAFLIGTFLFVLLISLSYSIAYFQYNRISNMQTNLANSIFDGKFSYTLFGNDICLENNFREVSNLLAFQGKSLEDLEDKFGKKDRGVLERKKFYTILLLEHLDYLNLYNEKCNSSIDYVLFFYSNNNLDKDKSVDAGRILDYVYANEDDLIIYSFDYNLNSEIIFSLIEKYDIESVPHVVVNGNQSFTWPFRSENVSGILNG